MGTDRWDFAPPPPLTAIAFIKSHANSHFDNFFTKWTQIERGGMEWSKQAMISMQGIQGCHSRKLMGQERMHREKK